MGAPNEYVLQALGISKSFTGTKALDNVDFSVRPGEIHALLGGNGSGKSTLIKVLAGVHTADPGGTVTTNGREFPADQVTAAVARDAGLRFVHQNLGLFPDMTVAENLSAGPGFPTAGGRIRWKDVNARAERLIERFSIGRARPSSTIGSLRPADRTLVAIARALQDQEELGSSVLFLDEPTTALPPREVDALLERLRAYAEDGQSIVFVSHRLPEIRTVADRVTVIRDGRNAGTTSLAGVTEPDLVQMIVGRPVGQVYPEARQVRSSKPMLSVRGLGGGPVQDLDLDVAPGEIVGVAGLLGSGRSTLLHLLIGDRRRTSGSIRLDDAELRPDTVTDAMKAGVALVPEDRTKDASFLDHSVQENLSAAYTSRYWRGMRLRHGRERRDTVRLIADFGIKATSGQPLQTLSGGNQQKVILARWLRREPRLLLLDEPTQGVDIGARVEIYRMIRDAADRGAAVLVVSSDFDELSHLCSRVVVLNAGRLVAEAVGDELEPSRLTELSFATALSFTTAPSFTTAADASRKASA